MLSLPFSDLTSSKVRPVIVISDDSHNKRSEDMIVVPMTANLKIAEYTLLVTNKDLESGKLIKDSKIKTDRIFSISQKVIKMKIGKIKGEVMKKVKEELLKLF